MQTYLSVILPAYNEAVNIQAGALDNVVTYLKDQDYTWEVLVVDDGSLDKTAELVVEFASRHPGIRLIENPHRGKAYAVSTGLLQANGEILVFSDMDQATPIREIRKLIPWFELGNDVVIGSRGVIRRNAPLWRKLMSVSQVVLRNLILGFHEITDTQCGFKAFRKSAVNCLLSRLHLFSMESIQHTRGASVTAGFDIEVLYIAKKLGMKIKAVPVEWDYKRTRRVNLLKDSFQGVRDLLRIRGADIRGLYNHHPEESGTQTGC